LLQIKTSAPAGPQNEDASNVILPWKPMSEMTAPRGLVAASFQQYGKPAARRSADWRQAAPRGRLFITFQSFPGESIMSNLRVLDSAFTDPFDGKVRARYADRVLTLELPKKASAAAKQITVQ
jgi:hypothetical protein